MYLSYLIEHYAKYEYNLEQKNHVFLCYYIIISEAGAGPDHGSMDL